MDATRRALFSAALALTTTPTAHAAGLPSFGETPAIAHAAAEKLIAALNVPGLVSDADAYVIVDEVMRLEIATLDGPITSRVDAAAKLRIATKALEDGEYADGRDKAALAQVAAWLEAA